MTNESKQLIPINPHFSKRANSHIMTRMYFLIIIESTGKSQIHQWSPSTTLVIEIWIVARIGVIIRVVIIFIILTHPPSSSTTAASSPLRLTSPRNICTRTTNNCSPHRAYPVIFCLFVIFIPWRAKLSEAKQKQRKILWAMSLHWWELKKRKNMTILIMTCSIRATKKKKNSPA